VSRPIEELIGKRVEVDGYDPQTGQRGRMTGEVSDVFMVIRTSRGDLKAAILDIVRVLPKTDR
jgi:hypothetical protein